MTMDDDVLGDPLDGDRELFRRMKVGHELLAATRQAEQQLMNAWRAMNPGDGDHGPSSIQIMEEAWAKLTPEQQEEALRHDLFNAYWHHTRAVQDEADMAAMARINGSSFLEHMDLETLDFAHVSLVDEDWTTVTRAGTVADYKDRPEEVLPQRASATIELEVLWRLIQEIKLLQFRQRQSIEESK